MQLAEVVLPFVKSLRPPHTPIELELRMGRATPTGTFQARVTKQEMDAILRSVVAAAGTTGTDTVEWHESHDVFFEHAGDTVRSSVAFDTDTFSMHTTHAVKRRIACTDAPRFRVASASETPLQPQALPFATTVRYMRIKQRRSITVQPAELSAPLWRYDFTLVWGGVTKQEAELRQRSEPPTYEVEVEVLAAGARDLLRLARAAVASGQADATVSGYLQTRLFEIGEALASLMD